MPSILKRSKRTASAAFLLCLIAGTIWIVWGRGTNRLYTAEGLIFGTAYHIKYEHSANLDSQIVAKLNEVDRTLSVFNPHSTLSRINRGEAPAPAPMLQEVMAKALQISEATHGAFDPTVMPLVNAWGFGFKHSALPTDAEVDSLKALVGYEKLILHDDGRLSKQDPRVMIDLGAIAKGYAVDCVARLLSANHIRNYMVEIGGEVITHGRHPEGHPWQIGISKPQADAGGEAGSCQTILSLENAALATSGNYHNFYVRDGRKYAHTIDPRTGRPVTHSLLSATVAANDCATADAYATAFMVMGLEEAKTLLKAHKELGAYLIYADDKGRLATFATGKVFDRQSEVAASR